MMSSNSSLSSSPNSPGTSNPTRGSDTLGAINAMMDDGISPKVLLSHFAPSFNIPPGADDMMLWRLLVSMIEPPKRNKLIQYSTIEHAIELIGRSKKIMVLSGAGISTSAGLPDFRSRNGIYVQIHAEHPDLYDPKCMFDIEYFRKNPLPFYQFAKALYPGQYKPTIGHKFIRCLEEHNKLLRNYSQNIDTLEKQAGIKNVVECHGSFAEATCTKCKYMVDGDVIRADILGQKVPYCPKCSEQGGEDGAGLMKPNIVFFGEQLGENFHSSLDADKNQVDLLIVIGSSLKVRPVALIPRHIPPNVPQILINKEPLDHMHFDIELLGNCDDIIQELCLRLGDSWTHICKPGTLRLEEVIGIPPVDNNVNINASIEPRASTEQQKVEQPSQSGEVKTDSSEKEIEHDKMSMGSVPEEGGDELSSFKSNQANVASESVGQNTIEELDEDKDCVRQADNNGSAISTGDDSSDEDWEDIEVLHSSDPLENARRRASVQVPEKSYFFLKPNRYLFHGVELTMSQCNRFIRESKSEETKPPQ